MAIHFGPDHGPEHDETTCNICKAQRSKNIREQNVIRFTAADLTRAVEAERALLMRMMRDVVQRARRNGDAFTVDEYIAGIEADYEVTRLRARGAKT